MIKNWLTGINLGIAGLALFFALLGFGILLMRPSEIPVPESSPEKATLPEGAFKQEPEEYADIGPPLMDLNYSPLSLQLPDLRNYLVYYGRNERPDATQEESMMHFSFTGSKDIASIAPDQPLYLVYDKDQPRVKYRFSPGNSKTSLWLEVAPGQNEAVVNVAMRNESGEIIRKPAKFARFSLKEKQFSRFGGTRWELGKWKVDGTLLARQRARWYGQDLFLQKHGGEEYEELRDKQRIDFGQDEDAYSVYLGPEGALIWKDGRWQETVPGEGSEEYPLLVVNKIDERLMKLDLWDVDGKARVTLNLIKSSEASPPQNIEDTFKFVGARTRSQLMFEVNNERMLISPQDWLLNFGGEWVKLDTPEEIDAYVERRLVGPLFVVDDIVSDEGRQVLLGTLFNATRTEVKAVEIPLQQGAAPAAPYRGRERAVEEQSDEDDDIFGTEEDIRELEQYRSYIRKFRETYGDPENPPEELKEALRRYKRRMQVEGRKNTKSR